MPRYRRNGIGQPSGTGTEATTEGRHQTGPVSPVNVRAFANTEFLLLKWCESMAKDLWEGGVT